MKNIRFLLVALVALIAACGGGSLYNVPSLNNFDFKYMGDFKQPYSVLNSGETVTLYSSFVWKGNPGERLVEQQHAVLAFTQPTVKTMENSSGDEFWTHGAGALVSESGLEIELWKRDDVSLDGYQNDRANAVVWNQFYDRCARDVLGTIPEGVDCLSPTVDQAGYITSAPNFVLTKGTPYVLRIQLHTTQGSRMSIEADLYTVLPGMGLERVQHGLVWFDKATHFPIVGRDLEATVARTPGTVGESVIEFKMFR